MRGRSCIVVLLVLLFNIVVYGGAVDISGEWSIRACSPDGELQEGKINLPSDIASQGYGYVPNSKTRWIGDVKPVMKDKKYKKYFEDNNYKHPFWLQPDRHFRGVASFEKEVFVPKEFEDRRVILSLERPHTTSALFINDRKVGECRNMGIPHRYDITDFIVVGKNNKVRIDVDNDYPLNVGRDSHGASDHTQGNWNGIVGDMKIFSTSKVWIDDMRIYPSKDLKSATVEIFLKDRDRKKSISGIVNLEIRDGAGVIFSEKRDVLDLGEKVSFLVKFKNPKVWDEFNPNMYEAVASINGDRGHDEKRTKFGLKNVEISGLKILLNGKEIKIRATLECCIFPKTGYPPTDRMSWERIMKICKAHGLNSIRFHSWCPPQVAFEVADEMGIYLQVENSHWGVAGQGEGKGSVDDWIYEETDAQLKEYGNHPSFIMYSQGNEPKSPIFDGKKSDSKRLEFLSKWVRDFRNKDSRHIYTTGSGWPRSDDNDYNCEPDIRLQQWGEELNSEINKKPPSTAYDYSDRIGKTYKSPIVSHEIGQWCVYPDFDEIKKYDGVLKAKNFEVFWDFLKEKGLEDKAKDFLMASGKLQVLCYKADIEALLRTSNSAGFQLLDLHDFPGQGTALVGILDAFWDSKPYCSPEEYSKFCNSVVPLAILNKMLFRKGEDISGRIKISNFSEGDLKGSKVICRLLKGKKVLGMEELYIKGGVIPHGLFEAEKGFRFSTKDISTPEMLKLAISVESSNGKRYENEWNVWVYDGEKVDIRKLKNVKVVEELSDEVGKFLEEGGTVWLRKNGGGENKHGLGFSSIFWNTAWTSNQLPRTQGILCDPKNGALEKFPTDYHSDYQWWEIFKNGNVMLLEGGLGNIEPSIQVVPDWFNPLRLAFAYEAKVGKGKIFVSNINFDVSVGEENLALKQLEKSISDYLSSDKFSPKVEVNIEDIKRGFE